MTQDKPRLRDVWAAILLIAFVPAYAAFEIHREWHAISDYYRRYPFHSITILGAVFLLGIPAGLLWMRLTDPVRRRIRSGGWLLGNLLVTWMAWDGFACAWSGYRLYRLSASLGPADPPTWMYITLAIDIAVTILAIVMWYCWYRTLRQIREENGR